MSKPRWVDMIDDDDDELELPAVISKHGIKVKKSVQHTSPPQPAPYVPPHQRQDKTKPRIDNKK